MIFSLKNKLALITGGGAGIGLEIARCMIAAGARVVITGRTESKLTAAVKELGPSAFYRLHDVTAHSTHEGLIQEIEDNVGNIDILVNNAGINMKKNALEVSNEEFASIIDTNLNAVFALTRVTAKRMVKRGKGVILMISSMAAYYGIDRVVAYAASKSGIEGMVKVLASDLSPSGIRINAIAPGFIETSMMKTAFGSDPDRMHKAMDRTPLGRFGKPEDVGWAAVYLASDEANFITGVSLRVDGGNAIGF
jgi:NAD(P)-dependent dehydrogenase (short-subunit alcohol dehydrogenase family)